MPASGIGGTQCHVLLAIDTGVCSASGDPCCTSGISYTHGTCQSYGSTPPVLSWYFDDVAANNGGAMAGQAAVVNDLYGYPCMVALTDATYGTLPLVTLDVVQGGCGLEL